MQGPACAVPRLFLRVLSAVNNFDRCDEVSPLDKDQVHLLHATTAVVCPKSSVPRVCSSIWTPRITSAGLGSQEELTQACRCLGCLVRPCLWHEVPRLLPAQDKRQQKNYQLKVNQTPGSTMPNQVKEAHIYLLREVILSKLIDNTYKPSYPKCMPDSYCTFELTSTNIHILLIECLPHQVSEIVNKFQSNPAIINPYLV